MIHGEKHRSSFKPEQTAKHKHSSLRTLSPGPQHPVFAASAGHTQLVGELLALGPSSPLGAPVG